MQYSWEEVIIRTDQEGFLEMTFALNDVKNQGQRMVKQSQQQVHYHVAGRVWFVQEK